MVVIEWCTQSEEIPKIVKLFCENLDKTYISHSEIQCGRAKNEETWSEEISQVLTIDFNKALPKMGQSWVYRLITVKKDNELVGFALIQYEETPSNRFCILQDLVISSIYRNQGLGKDLLLWIDQQLIRDKIERMYLESGVTNRHAHAFFEKLGYKHVSVVMTRTLQP